SQLPRPFPCACQTACSIASKLKRTSGICRISLLSKPGLLRTSTSTAEPDWRDNDSAQQPSIGGAAFAQARSVTLVLGTLVQARHILICWADTPVGFQPRR